MKIIEKSSTVYLKDLESGDVFKFPKNPTTYYMKVEGSSKIYNNSVDLETGELKDVADFAEVLFMKDATLTIQ